jgi:glutaredoxin-related protein
MCSKMQNSGVELKNSRRWCSIGTVSLDHKSYREWPTIPQLYVNGEFVGGSDITLSSELT